MKVAVSYLVLSVATIFLPATHGFPNGPPLTACKTMYPEGHGVDANIVAPPYNLTVSTEIIIPGQNVTVTLQATNPSAMYFEGMFVQARLASCTEDKPIGTFYIANDGYLQLLNCEGRTASAVAHKAHSHETSKTFTWMPSTSERGHVFFRATVVNRKDTFWTNVFSPYLRDTSDTSQIPTKRCEVQSKLGGAASSIVSVTSLLVAAFVIAVQFL